MSKGVRNQKSGVGADLVSARERSEKNETIMGRTFK